VVFYKNIISCNYFFLKLVIPNFFASATAPGANEVNLLIRVSLDGCVLKNSGGALLPAIFLKNPAAPAASYLFVFQ